MINATTISHRVPLSLAPRALRRRRGLHRGGWGLLVIPLLSSPAAAQRAPGEQGSRNVHIVSHIPLPGGGNRGVPNISNIEIRTADVELEQELSRPYAYVPMIGVPPSINFISLKEPKGKLLYTWTIENPDLHQGLGSITPAYLKTRGRYYYVNGFQFTQGSANSDLAAIVFDVTGLPDTSTIKEVERIRLPEAPGGFHEIFAYKHSSGAPLFITTTETPFAHIYDLDKLLAKAPSFGLVGKVPVPDPNAQGGRRGYHDFYAGYHPDSRQDRLYAAGSGGYYVFDITDLGNPKLLTSATGIAGITGGHTFTPTPDGRYAVLETEYQYAPIRIIDLKPGLDGTVKTISRPIGAWTAAWDGNPHNHEVRWPYVFVSAFEDGLQVINMMDPTNPYTVGYYDTYDKPRAPGATGHGMRGGMPGAFGVDVRNADGLIVISDMLTGFWAFKMDGFDGWDGRQWGMPNVSSAQDWDNGPEGAPKPVKVS